MKSISKTRKPKNLETQTPESSKENQEKKRGKINGFPDTWSCVKSSRRQSKRQAIHRSRENHNSRIERRCPHEDQAHRPHPRPWPPWTLVPFDSQG